MTTVHFASVPLYTFFIQRASWINGCVCICVYQHRSLHGGQGQCNSQEQETLGSLAGQEALGQAHLLSEEWQKLGWPCRKLSNEARVFIGCICPRQQFMFWHTRIHKYAHTNVLCLCEPSEATWLATAPHT